ncbi:MAG: hypothetical protein AAGB10_23345, partial [Pseudomonadota bacterium]
SIGAGYTTASSKTGGGTAERAAIPESVTDTEGRIGERRAGRVADTAPAKSGSGRVPAGTARPADVAAPPQRDDMQIAAERVGHRTTPGTKTPAHAVAASAAPIAQPPTGAALVPGRTVATAPPVQQPAVPETASPAPAVASSAPPATEPYKPDQPFSRGVKRPGMSRFISGTRRR